MMNEWEYKGFTIRKRDKGLHTSGYDYDWSYEIDGIPFWKSGPSLENAKREIDDFLVDQSFLEIDTTEID